MPTVKKPAPTLPVARVLPLLSLPQLDRLFDYYVPESCDETAQPGVRVRIRFAGRLIDGILVSRVDKAQHQGKLSYLERVVSPIVVYPPSTARLVESLAARYGGVRADIIRAALPSRHAGAEKADHAIPWEELGTATEPDLSAWSGYVHGENFVDAVVARRAARAAWQIAPGEDWAAALSALAVKVVLSGGGALIIVPDGRDVELMEARLRQLVAARQITTLTAALGPQARYRRFLSILSGQGKLVVGTRSAAYSPVRDLALAVVVNDGDTNLVDPRAPYIHAREVLTTRAAQEGCSLIIAGHSRTAEAQLLVESGWAHDVVASMETRHTRMPWVHAVSDHEVARDARARSDRLPAMAFRAARNALERDTAVLIQVPRKGYIPTLSCASCRTPARCRACNGPLEIPPSTDGRGAVPACRWCGRPEAHFHCVECGAERMRAVVLGTERTAEELGRAFPGVSVTRSRGEQIVTSIAPGKRIVIATPGAEPRVEGGSYGAALLLDTWALLGRQDLRASEDTLAAWAAAATLVEPRRRGGEVVVVADSSLPVVQRLISWDMVGAASRELDQRREAGLPPAVRMAAVDAPATSLHEFLRSLELPDGAEVLGPVDMPRGVSLPGEYDTQSFGIPQRAVIRAPLGPRNELGAALKAATVLRAVRKDTLPLRVTVDPLQVG